MGLAVRVSAVSLLAGLITGVAGATSVAGHVARLRCLIAFSRNDNALNLALYDRASGRVRDLTYDGGDDTAPAWSPDGQWLAFTRENAQAAGVNSLAHIWITDLADNQRQLTIGMAGDADPVWSPDGREIAFVRDGIFVVSVKTRRVQRLTGARAVYGLSWSPDGRKLAYGTARGIQTFDLRTHRTTLARRNATDPQYLADGLLAYRLGNTFRAGRRSLTISFADRGQWNTSATALVFASFVDPNLPQPPPTGLYVERVGALHPRHLYVSDFAGDPTWRPGC